MSTHNIGFYEDLTKIIFELSSIIIKFAPYFFCCLAIKLYVVGTHWKSLSEGCFNEYPQLMLVWRNKQNYLLIIAEIGSLIQPPSATFIRVVKANRKSILVFCQIEYAGGFGFFYNFKLITRKKNGLTA